MAKFVVMNSQGNTSPDHIWDHCVTVLKNNNAMISSIAFCAKDFKPSLPTRYTTFLSLCFPVDKTDNVNKIWNIFSHGLTQTHFYARKIQF